MDGAGQRLLEIRISNPGGPGLAWSHTIHSERISFMQLTLNLNGLRNDGKLNSMCSIWTTKKSRPAREHGVFYRLALSANWSIKALLLSLSASDCRI